MIDWNLGAPMFHCLVQNEDAGGANRSGFIGFCNKARCSVWEPGCPKMLSYSVHWSPKKLRIDLPAVLRLRGRKEASR